MYKIAFLNIECFSCSAAVQSIIEEHSDQIRLVVASDPNKGQEGLVDEARKHFKRSGAGFNHYLALNFVYHPLALSILGLLRRIFGLPFKRRSLEQTCERAGVPYVMSANVNSPEILELLRQHEIDLVISFYFDQILRSEFISIPAHGVVNFHPAILPDCRGLFPVIFSAVRNNRKFGMTAHDIVDETIDTGPILATTVLTEPETRSILQLELAVNNAGARLLSHVIKNLPELRGASQNQSASTGHYYSYPSREDLAALKPLGIRLTSTRDFLEHYREKEGPPDAVNPT